MEPESIPPEVAIEEEPRYLRRQKPVAIKRRKFGRRALSISRRAVLFGAGVVAGGWLIYVSARFLLRSPQMLLAHPSQIELAGNHYVERSAVLEVFAGDRRRSVLRVPLDERRRQLEQIPWVEQAVVRRAMPNRIQVELVERAPVAFLRAGADLALVDIHGVILDRPLAGNFQFPVVAGLTEQMPAEERERRMQLYASFLKSVDAARSGASEQVSEVDLSDANDLRATLAGMPELAGQGPVLVHFGDGDFQTKFQLLLDNLAQWRTSAGRVDSVDLRFSREVVVNPAGTGKSSPSVRAAAKLQ
jgi:cell division protein FtsQ